jgi:chemotaxis protein CheX
MNATQKIQEEQNAEESVSPDSETEAGDLSKAELKAEPPAGSESQIEIDDPTGLAIIKLKSVLNVTSAMATARQFLDLRGRDVIVDASQVQHLGGQTLQILLSAVRIWSEDGHSFALSECSDKFIDDLKLFGFAPHQFTAVESLP